MSSAPLTAVIIVGSSGESPQEQLVLAARRACTRDLIATLDRFDVPVIVAAPDAAWLPPSPHVTVDRDEPGQPFHFGQRLAGVIQHHGLQHVLYFGGGSTPLLDDSLLGLIIGLLGEAASAQPGSRIPGHIALTNNRHSSDWLALSHAPDALAVIASADRDNSLAWLLDQDDEYEVRVAAGLRPAASLDLDTPTDLAITALYPQLGVHLAKIVADSRLDDIPLRQVAQIAATPESNLTLIGRVGPLPWQALNKATQCWIRVFAEERGMVASGRQARGEVRSLVGALIEQQGPATFFDTLAGMTDAALIDTRPLMAAQGRWPSDADRFASDLYAADAISDPWLRAFAQAAYEAPIPVVLGGHSLVAGGLYALAEVIEQGIIRP